MKKKTIYTFAAALFMSATVAMAQTTSPAQPTQGSNYNTVNSSFGNPVTTSAIPDPLKTTLQGSQYKGWENGTMYFNPSTNQYSLQMPSTVGTTPAVNPLAPSSPSTPMSTAPVQGATPTTPNPMGGLQTQPMQTQPQPGSPLSPQVTIYRFDQNGKLIPQN